MGSSGPDVADLQRRLSAAGFPIDDKTGLFDELTGAAVTKFQRARGLREDGACDATTWSALIESGFAIGDRLLCLRSPMMRGDDVSDLQLRLGVFGFDAGRVDGIFGQMTQRAVGEFQRNAGLVCDTVCGPETVGALLRLEGRSGKAAVTGVRERERLRRRRSTLHDLRIAVGMTNGPHSAMSRFAFELQSGGSLVLLLEDMDWGTQANQVNDFQADLFIGLSVTATPMIEACYFSVPGYESVGGRRLAELVVSEMPASPGWGIGTVRGTRLQIVRETRPPAVLIRVGDAPILRASEDLVIASLRRAIDAWVHDPC
ncbi:MAG: peptidoglycan-binding protein [Microthrixaceae bacterium]